MHCMAFALPLPAEPHTSDGSVAPSENYADGEVEELGTERHPVFVRSLSVAQEPIVGVRRCKVAVVLMASLTLCLSCPLGRASTVHR
jgi:hypothetical protein